MARPITNFGQAEFGEKLFLGFQGGDTDEWEPGFFDVINPEDGKIVIERRALVQYDTEIYDSYLWFLEIDTAEEDTDGDLFEPRHHYLLNIYENVTDPPSDAENQIRGVFYVATGMKKMLNRVLGWLGENMVIDNYTYDQPGNITSQSVRLFATAANAAAANQGATGPEVGEFAQFDVDQNHSLPRSLRSFHLCRTSYMEDDRE